MGGLKTYSTAYNGYSRLLVGAVSVSCRAVWSVEDATFFDNDILVTSTRP